MIWYLLEFSDRNNATNIAWGLMGLSTKLAQSVRLAESLFDVPNR